MSKLFEALQRLGQEPDPVDAELLSETRVVLQPLRPVRNEPSTGHVARGIKQSQAPSDLQHVAAVDGDIPVESRITFQIDPHGPGADRFRFLRMRLRQLKQAQNVKTLLVTSPLPRDGKTTVVLNLATALAEDGKRNVLVMDADLHHSSLCNRLSLEPKAGLAECLEHRAPPLSALQYIQPLGWYFLGAGQAHGNPMELLQSNAFPAALQFLSPHFDWIVLDSPPILPLSDTVALRPQADASLLVVRAGSTPRDAIHTAIERLGPKHVAAIVLNGAEELDRVYSSYYTP